MICRIKLCKSMQLSNKMPTVICTLLAFYVVGADLVSARYFIYYVIKEEIAARRPQ